ncbi:phenylacetic acid degradation-like protein [Mycobacteroides abscessus subsp. abscessus]|nr:phenylacetic acid degradation-like protein [Mycobacteroides abscessus subsp. abscessus]
MTMPDRPPFIGDLLGMEVDEIEHGRVVFAVRTRQDFANPLGTTHGGICATLLDSVMGCAVHTTLEAGVGYAEGRVVDEDGRLVAHGTTTCVIFR